MCKNDNQHSKRSHSIFTNDRLKWEMRKKGLLKVFWLHLVTTQEFKSVLKGEKTVHLVRVTGFDVAHVMTCYCTWFRCLPVLNVSCISFLHMFNVIFIVIYAALLAWSLFKKGFLISKIHISFIKYLYRTIHHGRKNVLNVISLTNFGLVIWWMRDTRSWTGLLRLGVDPGEYNGKWKPVIYNTLLLVLLPWWTQAPQIPHPMNQACNIEPVVSFSLS